MSDENTLARVGELINQANELLRSVSPASTSRSTVRTPDRLDVPRNIPPQPQPGTSTGVLSELRRLYSPYPVRNSPARRLARPRHERKWTHKFFAFDNPTEKSPTIDERSDLQSLGYGFQSLEMGIRGTSCDVVSTISVAFPGLANRGLKLCRARSGGPFQQLHKISENEDVPNVADLASGSLGIIYIVPLVQLVEEVTTPQLNSNETAGASNDLHFVMGSQSPNDERCFPSPILNESSNEANAPSSGRLPCVDSNLYPGVNLDQEDNCGVYSVDDSDSMEPVTMQEYRALWSTVHTGEEHVIVQREDFLLQVLGIYKKPNFNVFKKPNVIFVNEPGRDVGALTKEFFYLGMNAIMNEHFEGVPLFAGKDDNKVPMDDICLLQSGVFEKIGMFFVHSAIHTSVSCIGLSRVVAEFLCGEEDELPMDVTIDIDDIPEEGIRELVLVMRDTLFSSIPNDQKLRIQQLCYESGFYKTISESTVDLATEWLVYFHAFLKRKEQILAIKKAFRIQSLNVFLARRKYLWDSVFPLTSSLKVPTSLVKGRIEFLGTDVHVASAVLDFIDASGDCIDSVIRAWTGWPFLPEGSLILKAVDGGTFMVRSCAETMEIPKHWTKEKIKEYLTMLIEYGCSGFGSI